MAEVRKIEPVVVALKPRKRVAAYARISMESDRLNHSLSAQVSYYSKLIQNNPEWIYAGVYADSGISGGGIRRRAEFKRMVEDCDAGKIDVLRSALIQCNDGVRAVRPLDIWVLARRQSFLFFGNR